MVNYNDFAVTMFNDQKVGYDLLESIKSINSKYLIGESGKIKIHKV